MLKSAFFVLLLLVSFTGFAEDFIAGKDYEVIKSSDKSENVSSAVSVTEFFSFGCPWCYRVEPALNKWVEQQGAKIYFKKIPVVFNNDWEFYSRAYFTVHALSLNSKLDPLLFKAILVDKQPLNSNQSMIDYLTKNGVDATTAQSAFNHSPSVDLEITASQTLMTRYHITAVPALVVNNLYKTDLKMAKTEQRLFEILDFLVTQAKQQK